jgi:eukaryotic-like serine/threonine-protein kinase
MLDTGKVVQERYRIVRLLGQGGMGAVYRAWDLRLKVPVALKELRPQPGLDAATLAGLRDQFEQEASVLARLIHPNLVRVTDYFEEEGNAYLVMDFIDGRSLSDVILQDGAQSEAKTSEWSRQLLEALAYCHAQGVVHRDIKPQNIILKPDGAVILVDFGLVKLWDEDDPRTRAVMRGMGTPEYAPPEQYSISQDHTGPPSDVYSLGATLYHLLTGQAPATATERMAIPEAFQPLRRLAPHVSERFEQLVMRALALSVSERWSSARDMLAQLVSGPLPVYSPTPYASQPVVSAPTVMVPGGTTLFSGQAPIEPQTVHASSAPPRSGRSSRVSVPLIVGGGLFVCVVLACLGYFVGMPLVRGLLDDEPVATQSSTGMTPITGSTSTTPPTSTPDDPSPTRVTTSPTSGEFRVTVANNSPDEICYVQISDVDQDEWGENWLAGDETILSGMQRPFDLPEGAYDMRMQRCDTATMATFWRVYQDTSLEVGAAGATARLLVENDASVDVCFLYVSPTTADDWGQDWLGELEVLKVDNTRVVYVRPGDYDLQFMDCDNIVLAEAYGVSLRQDRTWTITD